MPKTKTCSGAKKRFRLTGNGKLRRAKANKSHILTKKKRKRKRRLRQSAIVDSANRKSLKRLMPYA